MEPVAVITFLRGWRTEVEGVLRAGGQVRIEYDLERLPDCREEWRGHQQWDITAFFRFYPGGAVGSRSLVDFAHPYLGQRDGGGNPKTPRSWTAKPLTLDVPAGATLLELWFCNSGREPWMEHDCQVWDSRFGQNYQFEIRSGC